MDYRRFNLFEVQETVEPPLFTEQQERTIAGLHVRIIALRQLKEKLLQEQADIADAKNSLSDHLDDGDDPEQARRMQEYRSEQIARRLTQIRLVLEALRDAIRCICDRVDSSMF